MPEDVSNDQEKTGGLNKNSQSKASETLLLFSGQEDILSADKGREERLGNLDDGSNHSIDLDEEQIVFEVNSEM